MGEIEIVQKVVTMRAEGRTLREIAAHLAPSGAPTRRGEQVRSMVKQAAKTKPPLGAVA